MPTKQAVVTDKAPAPLPFYSQAIIANGVVYCSGAVGMDPVTRKLAEGDVKARTVYNPFPPSIHPSVHPFSRSSRFIHQYIHMKQFTRISPTLSLPPSQKNILTERKTKISIASSNQKPLQRPRSRRVLAREGGESECVSI
jgi:hypothetical protein